MVAPPLVLDVYQVNTIGLLNTMPCDHVINWHMPGFSTSAGDVAQQFANGDAVAWMDAFRTSLPPYYSHIKSTGTYLGDRTTPVGSTTDGRSGSGTGNYGAHQVCVTMKHHVPVRGRGRQGRTNIPGPATEAILQPSGIIDPAVVTVYNTAFANYTSAIRARLQSLYGVTPELVVLSRKLGTYIVPNANELDTFPNTHRRWQKRLARH